MENKSHALAAGSFVLLLSAVLVSLAAWLTRDTRSLLVYELAGVVNVSGLQPQANVRYSGVSVGKVSAISLDPLTRGQVLVRIAVEETAPISSQTYATLAYQGVTGLAFIQLDDTPSASGAQAARLPPNSRILLKPSLVSKLTDRAEHLLGQLEQSSQRVNQWLSGSNQQAVLSTISQIGEAASELKQLATQARHTLPPLAKTSQDTLVLLQAATKRVADSADAARNSARALQRVTDRLATPGGTLDQFSTGTDVLLATGQTLHSETLPSLNRSLSQATRATQQIGELTQTLTRHPQALLLGAPAPLPGPGEPGFIQPSVAP